MKRVIALVTLLCFHVYATPQSLPLGGIAQVAAASYVLSEDFEGSNNCTASASGVTNRASCNSVASSFILGGAPATADFGYTTSPLEGTKSLRLVNASGTNSIKTTAALNLTHVYVFFEFMPVTASFSSDFFDMTDSGSATDMADLNVVSGSLHMWNGSDHTSAFAITSGTKYYFWIEYQKGTGANSIHNVYASTTTTKPGTPTIAATNGTVTVNADHLLFLTTVASQEAKYDHIRISTSDITGYP